MVSCTDRHLVSKSQGYDGCRLRKTPLHIGDPSRPSHAPRRQGPHTVPCGHNCVRTSHATDRRERNTERS